MQKIYTICRMLFLIVIIGLFISSYSLADSDISSVKNIIEKANTGDIDAQHNLGIMYYKGQGVKQDYHKAKDFFGKACDNGLQIGCDKYRELNEKGY